MADAADDVLEEQDGWLLIPASGSVISDEDVRALRDEALAALRAEIERETGG